MTSPRQQISRLPSALKERTVTACRVCVFNDEKKELHVQSANRYTLNLILEDEQIIVLNMLPNQDDSGLLDIQHYPSSSHLDVVKQVDIPAIGFPHPGFPNREHHGDPLKVEDFFTHILQQAFDRYRFLVYSGERLGSRTWVARVLFSFQENNLLTSITPPVDVLKSTTPLLDTVFEHNWHHTQLPYKLKVICPGMFLNKRHRSGLVSDDEYVAFLCHASPEALAELSKSLSINDETARMSIDQAVKNPGRQQKIFYELIDTVCKRTGSQWILFAALDIVQCPKSGRNFVLKAVEEKYPFASMCLSAVNRLSDEANAQSERLEEAMLRSDAYAYSLAAILEMAEGNGEQII